MANNLDLGHFRGLLKARHAELQALITTAHEHARPVELDQSRVGRLSRMDALQDQAMALETERRRKIELQKVEAALKRLETEDYGYCMLCDEEIPVKRLEFDPAATTCVDCARG